MIKAAHSEPQGRHELVNDADTGEMTLGQLVALARRGDASAASQIRKMLNDDPNLFGPLGQVACKVQSKWIGLIAGGDLFEKEMLLRATAKMRQSLIDEGTGTMMERILVEQVVSTYLQLNFHELREAQAPADDIHIAEHRLKKIESASKRHLKAMGALATLRSMSNRRDVEANSFNVCLKPTETRTGPAPGQGQTAMRSSNRVSDYFERQRLPISLN